MRNNSFARSCIVVEVIGFKRKVRTVRKLVAEHKLFQTFVVQSDIGCLLESADVHGIVSKFLFHNRPVHRLPAYEFVKTCDTDYTTVLALRPVVPVSKGVDSKGLVLVWIIPLEHCVADGCAVYLHVSLHVLSHSRNVLIFMRDNGCSALIGDVSCTVTAIRDAYIPFFGQSEIYCLPCICSHIGNL